MKRLFALIGLLFCYVCSWAQQGEFVLHSINLPAKFGQQIITSLEQDKQGMLWFVTNDGLFRFDGNDVVHLGADTDPKIAHLNIKSLFNDRKNNMWIGAQDGITKLNLHNWTTSEIKAPKHSSPLSLYIRTMTEDKNGIVYAGSQDGRVYKIVQDSMVCIFDMNLAFKDLYDLPNITFLQVVGNDQLWIGSSVGKLVRLGIHPDGTYSKPKFFGLDIFKKEQVVMASFNPQGNCIMEVPNFGLYFMNGTTGDIRKIKAPYGNIGTHGQVYMTPLDANRTIIMTNTPGIGKEKLFIYDFRSDSFSVQQLHYPGYLDENHIVWLSHTGSKILLSLNDHLLELAPSHSPFSAIMAAPKSLNSIRAVYKQPGGPLLAGSYKDGFVRFDEHTGEKQVVIRRYVYSILPWNKDTVLLSTEGNGLYWYEISLNKLTQIPITDDNINGKPMGKFLTFLSRYDKNHFLVGTYERLYKVNPYEHRARSVREDQLLKTRVLGILKRPNDYLIATENGILSWQSKTDTIVLFGLTTAEAELPAVPVYGMVAVGHEIWAATGGYGIVIYNGQGQSVDTIGKKEGLAAGIVFTLAATDKYILAGTKNGLSAINKQTHHITNYSTLDQLPANEFNSAAKFQAGNTVYLGTIDGVVRFNTDKLDAYGSEALEGNLYITELTVTDKKGNTVNDYTLPYQSTKGFRIAAGTAYFSIGFGSMKQSMEHLDYYYRLGADQQLISVGANRKVTFIGMPPGHYQLELVARLPDGNWSKTLLNMPIEVAPAFYQTIWFKLLLALLLIGLVWSVIKYREKQAEKERGLRLKIAGDLHDEIGSTLAGMSMQAEMLLSGHQQLQSKYLRSIADNGRAAVQTMGDIVWSIDPRNDDSLSLYQRMERYGNKVLGDSDIAIGLRSQGFTEKQYIPQKIRQNVMLIYKEALTNIIKHSDATRVDVRFMAYNKGFKLRIIDNGKGLQPEQLINGKPSATGHGLKNMEMRARLMEAELSFPLVENGFEVLLTFKG